MSARSIVSSLPGLTRQSILFARSLAKKMDPRVKPAGDTARTCEGAERA